LVFDVQNRGAGFMPRKITQWHMDWYSCQ
jgi:hypothetical protein